MERIRKLLWRLFVAFVFIWLVADVVPAIFFTIVNSAIHVQHENFKSTAELEEAFKKEKEKLGITADTDVVVVDDLPDAACQTEKVRVGFETIYKISVKKDYADLACVKHELYHIYGGHFSEKYRLRILNQLIYAYYYEPTAIVYVIFGWKL